MGTFSRIYDFTIYIGAMGCGGSKEEKKSSSAPAVAVNDKPQPIKKIRTNFSDIHYDEPTSARRNTEYAPSEVPESRRPTEIAEEGGSPAASPAPAPVKGADGMLSPGSPASPAASPAPEIQRSKSWWDKYTEKKTGKSLSDGDYQKMFGMTKEEFNLKMKDKPGVCGKQSALWTGDGKWASGGGGDG